MGGILINSNMQGWGLALEIWNVWRLLTQPPPTIPETGGPWRPPQWDKPQRTSITVSLPLQSVATPGVEPTAKTVSTTYFFDAVLRVHHQQVLRITEHPVQTGANIVDHAYMQPARVTLEIGMSDAMDRYQKGMFTSDPSKSVSAYQQLKKLQSMRVPMQVTTRLDTYKNMIIESIDTPDDLRTLHGLRAIVSLRQIITAQISTQKVSGRPQASTESPSGEKIPLLPSHAVENNFKIPALIAPSPFPSAPASIPGAGFWDSGPNSTQDMLNALAGP